MKAVVYHKYGSPDELNLEEVEKPTPKDNEVLIKVQAASVNDWDWGLLRGMPWLNRLPNGLRKPQYEILGADIAGRIEAVGHNVTRFNRGDEVFGDLCESGWGGFAEYVCAKDNALALKPASLSFAEAAAIPQAAMLALLGLRDAGQIKPGQKVLVNGAGGGAGSFAVQIAKAFDTEVTGVDSAEKLDIMRSIGADHVIDYTKEDFTRNGEQYDLIHDNAAHHSIFDYLRSLSPKGIYVMLGGPSSRIFQVMVLGPLISMTGGKRLGIMIHKPNKDLDAITALLEGGKVKSVIDKQYPLGETAEALRYFGAGHAKGKIVITM